MDISRAIFRRRTRGILHGISCKGTSDSSDCFLSKDGIRVTKLLAWWSLSGGLATGIVLQCR